MLRKSVWVTEVGRGRVELLRHLPARRGDLLRRAARARPGDAGGGDRGEGLAARSAGVLRRGERSRSQVLLQ